MRTAVIILNWNTGDYLSRFLPSLLDSVRGEDAQLIVADNGSSDGSLELMEREFPQIKTIALERNFGFTGGYNRAVKQLLAEQRPEYIVLINSDIEAEKGWLSPLVKHMDKHPECGVCGPKLHLLEARDGGYHHSTQFEYAGAAGGYLDRYGFPFCRGRVMGRVEEDRGQYDNNADLMWVSGACLMTRSSLWEQLGGLDESFFAHMEEIDYCWRAQLRGFRIDCVFESCVWHLGGGTLAQGSPFKLKLNYRNGLLLLHKNLAATVGSSKAARVIRTRKLIDRCASLSYLLKGDLKSFNAVGQAHKEFAELKDRVRISEPGAEVCGISGFSIIAQAALRGKNIFKYLKSYENCHPRCR